mgnify:CR=1 FL=1
MPDDWYPCCTCCCCCCRLLLVCCVYSWIVAIILPFVSKDVGDKRAAIASGITLGALTVLVVVVVVVVIAVAAKP